MPGWLSRRVKFDDELAAGQAKATSAGQAVKSAHHTPAHAAQRIFSLSSWPPRFAGFIHLRDSVNAYPADGVSVNIWR